MTLLLGTAMLLVVAVLFTGVLGFAKGGRWYERHANRLMNLRVLVQLIAVLLLAVTIWLSG